jgi:hypothetical protein
MGEMGFGMGVSMKPGQTAFTRMLRDPTSRATDRVNPRIPLSRRSSAGRGRTGEPAMLDMLMITPLFFPARS